MEGSVVIHTVYRVVIEYPGDTSCIEEVCNTKDYADSLAKEHEENGAIVSIFEEQKEFPDFGV